MESNMLWKTISKAKWQIILIGALFGAVSFVVLMMVAPRFVVTSDYLIVQNQGNAQDAYSAFKSLDYLGQVLNESVYSERFVDAVVETGKVDTNFLPANPFDRLNAWKKMVVVTRNANAGILHVEVRANDSRAALRVSEAVSDVLVQRNLLFRGGDDKSVEVRVLSGPIATQNPSRTEMILTVIGGFIAGVLLVLLWAFVRVEAHQRRLEQIHYEMSHPDEYPAPFMEVPRQRPLTNS